MNVTFDKVPKGHVGLEYAVPNDSFSLRSPMIELTYKGSRLSKDLEMINAGTISPCSQVQSAPILKDGNG